MSVRQSATNSRVSRYQVSAEATDLGVGVAIVPSALSLPFSPAILGYFNALAGYNNFSVGDLIIAEDTGNLWEIGRDSVDAKVLILCSVGSGVGIEPLRGLLFVDSAAAPGGDGSISAPF